MHRVDPFDPGIVVALAGFENKTNVFRNLDAPRLYEEAIRRREAEIADGGALVAATGAHTAVRRMTNSSIATRSRGRRSGGRTVRRCRLNISTVYMST